MSQSTHCPLCQAYQPWPLLQRENVPVHQHLLIRDQSRARDAAHGTLDIALCQHCGFVWNTAFDSSKLAYGADYDNTQTHSSFFEAYVDGLIHELTTTHRVRNSCIVEVGCGKGYFLRRLVADPALSNVGYGFDPTYVGPESDLDGRLRFVRQFYEPENTVPAVDVIICRHVIEHIPQPVEFLHTLRQTLDHTRQPRIFFETPCVEWILQQQVFWDFFYEHCSYFTAESLSLAFERAGFAVREVKHIWGGQYLWLEATTAETTPDAANPPATPRILALGKQFQAAEQHIVAAWQAQLEETAHAARVALWGAGAKGVTLANLIDPQGTLLACVVDLNPHKQGCFIPGSGHPIVDYRQLPQYGVNRVILMNPNYSEENMALLRQAQLDVQLINSADWSVLV